VKQLSANVVAINTTMQSLMEEIKQDLTTQLESVFSSLCTKLHIPTDNPSSDSPPHTDGEHSSHSHNFHHHHFQRDLRLLQVDVTKFDGSDPTGWVTQMENYLSIYKITYDLAKLKWLNANSKAFVIIVMKNISWDTSARNKIFLWPYMRIFWKGMLKLPLCLSHLKPLT
jgi:hypothetical protein